MANIVLPLKKIIIVRSSISYDKILFETDIQNPVRGCSQDSRMILRTDTSKDYGASFVETFLMVHVHGQALVETRDHRRYGKDK